MYRRSSLSKEVSSILDQQFKRQTQRKSSFIILLPEGQSFPGLASVSLSPAPSQRDQMLQSLSLSPSLAPAVPSPQIWSRTLWLGPSCSLLAGHVRSHTRSPCSGCDSCLPGCLWWLELYREPSTGPELCGHGSTEFGEVSKGFGLYGPNSLSLLFTGLGSHCGCFTFGCGLTGGTGSSAAVTKAAALLCLAVFMQARTSLVLILWGSASWGCQRPMSCEWWWLQTSWAFMSTAEQRRTPFLVLLCMCY